ncbi:MAG TPA: endonuclease III [Planctomycetota bacterium]|nr:endonuclease III [Planctomycetota bacterium]
MAIDLPKGKRLKDLRRRTARVARDLRKRFGPIPRPAREDPLESLVWTILSQNTNDLNSERAWRGLRRAFRTWTSMLEAPVGAIARAIRVGGLAKQKSRTIKDFLRWVKRTYGRLSLDAMHAMTPEEAVRVLTRHKGIGLKTVYVTLLFACGKDVFPVDTHIYRIVRRLALAPERFSRDRVTEWMQTLVPEGKAYELHLHLIRFGREVCKAQHPLCRDCPFRHICVYPDKNLSPR